jgi:hypothetical protein
MDTVEQPSTAEADDATGPEAKTAEGEAENHTEAEAVVADGETEAADVEGEATDADAADADADTDAADASSASATSTDLTPTSSAAAAPTPSPTPDPVCWICYETHADQTVDAPSTLVAPCKCSGSLRTVHQECLLAWMAQTDATACPHCHHTYDVDDSYPSTLQRLCDHPWGPPVVAGLVCGALFYAFHRLWVRMTRKRRVAAAVGGGSAAPGTTATMSGSRLLAMMGGGLPAHLLMLPQMGGGGAGGLFGAASVSPRTSWNLTGLLAEVEVFALLVMVVYGAARYLHKWGTNRSGEDEAEASQGEGNGGDDAGSTDAADTVSRWTTTASAGLEDLWATVDDLWAQSASGSARLSHEEALYTLPLDVLTTLFHVVEHYCKQLQTWGVAKARVVRAWDATQNNLPGNE